VSQRSKTSSSSGRRQQYQRYNRKRHAASRKWLLLFGTVGFIVMITATLVPVPRNPNAAEPMTMAQARASNAAVAIVTKRRVSAAAFHFHGGPAAREQAVECLATAALYEAGDDRRGQRGVIQVILNRARAPGFPATICGVVYQGSNRVTGCQFSFTCDGSFQRRPVHHGWTNVRRAARRALAGAVFPAVGTATHYHADWVVPYWRNSMTKVARVGPHLFYLRT
jgi:spore germination cell wall hydrolase CwlJ-like protein